MTMLMIIIKNTQVEWVKIGATSLCYSLIFLKNFIERFFVPQGYRLLYIFLLVSTNTLLTLL